MKKINLLGLNICTGSYGDFIDAIIQSAQLRQGRYACVANVHMLVEAYRNKNFGELVNNADVITPDGKPLTWALKWVYGIKQERVAGMDLLPDLISEAEKKQVPVYFYGGEQATLEKTQLYLSVKHPQLIVSGLYSPPYRQLSAMEELEIINTINHSGAKLLFVSLGCPKQEKWMASMRERINLATVGIGGALPVMIGAQKRAPVWMQKCGFEWLHRLSQEPRRLFKRYAVTNSIFIYLLAGAYIKQIRSRRKFTGA